MVFPHTPYLRESKESVFYEYLIRGEGTGEGTCSSFAPAGMGMGWRQAMGMGWRQAMGMGWRQAMGMGWRQAMGMGWVWDGGRQWVWDGGRQ